MGALYRCCKTTISVVFRHLRIWCHKGYSIVKNGIQGPAEARTGTIYKRFQAVVEAEALGNTLVPYLTWRYCYLICSMVFSSFYVVMGWRDSTPDPSRYDRLVEQLPKGFRKERFNVMITALAWWDTLIYLLFVLAFLISCIAVFFSCPCRALRSFGLSRRLVWSSWLANFAVPYAILLTFPVRSLIDWTEINNDVCTAAVLKVFGGKGVDVGSALSELAVLGVLSPDFKKVTTQANGETSEETVRKWCEHQASAWHEVFFSGVDCVWSAEAICRNEVCPEVPAPMLSSCLSNCVSFAQTAKSSKGNLSATNGQFLASLSHCNASEAITDPSTNNQLATFSALADSQRNAAEAIADASNTTVATAEYSIGIFMATRTGVLLLSSSLSILTGLAQSLLNIKAMFPGSQQAPWVLILVTFEALPIYAALLAIAQQLLGNHLLSFSCVALVIFLSLSAYTGATALKFQMGESERRRFSRRIWIEYGLRFIVGTFAVAMFLSFVDNAFGSIRVFRQAMSNSMPGLILLLTISFAANKIIMCVAGTDMLLSAFLQTELWRLGWTVLDHDEFDVQVKELGSLLAPALRARVHPCDPRVPDEETQNDFVVKPSDSLAAVITTADTREIRDLMQ